MSILRRIARICANTELEVARRIPIWRHTREDARSPRMSAQAVVKIRSALAVESEPVLTAVQPILENRHIVVEFAAVVVDWRVTDGEQSRLPTDASRVVRENAIGVGFAASSFLDDLAAAGQICDVRSDAIT